MPQYFRWTWERQHRSVVKGFVEIVRKKKPPCRPAPDEATTKVPVGQGKLKAVNKLTAKGLHCTADAVTNLGFGDSASIEPISSTNAASPTMRMQLSVAGGGDGSCLALGQLGLVQHRPLDSAGPMRLTRRSENAERICPKTGT